MLNAHSQSSHNGPHETLEAELMSLSPHHRRSSPLNSGDARIRGDISFRQVLNAASHRSHNGRNETVKAELLLHRHITVTSSIYVLTTSRLPLPSSLLNLLQLTLRQHVLERGGPVPVVKPGAEQALSRLIHRQYVDV